MAEAAPGEWPVGLLLDEVWLRTRRRLIGALERAGVWPGAADYRRFLQAQRARGVALRDEVLLPALGEEDGRWLLSPGVFAASNRRFRSRTPMSLAFGHALGEGLRTIDGSDGCARTAQTCALFNFGISVFDLLHDTQPRLIPAFAARFDAGTLESLHRDPGSAGALERSSADCDEPEVRLLLRLIALFYLRLERLAAGASGDARAGTFERLTAAYAAEIESSAVPRGADPARRLEVSRTKSGLPFAVIGSIVELARGPCATADEAADLLGVIFWRLDDLVDVIGDVRSGAVNSLVLESSDGRAIGAAATLHALLDGNVVETVVAEIEAAMLRLRALVGGREPRTGRRLDDVVSGYVRMWIE